MKTSAKEYYEKKRAGLSNAELRSQDRISFSDIDIANIQKIHITAVCGTAMASLADLLIQKGFVVTGSDSAFYPPMGTVIENLGIEKRPFAIENVQQADIVIIGNMCPPTNIEAAYCRENNTPYFSIGEVLGSLCIEDKKSIVISGTHGKTTTTGLAITLLEKIANNETERPSYLVGGVIKETGKSAVYTNESQYFVIEGDEYDTAYFDKAPKFLHYKPYVAILTSLELDHIDIYKDIQDYTQAFDFLIDELADDGVLFACADDSGVRALIENKETTKQIFTYGKSDDADLRLISSEIVPEKGQNVQYMYNGETLEFFVPMFGEYNALNALAVQGIGHFLQKNKNDLATVFLSYASMKRRQEIFGEKNGIIVIDDFAHHPTAVEKTLKGIRERFPSRYIYALFEPRSNTSRSKLFEAEYGTAFSSVDSVYLSVPPVKKEGFNPDEFMDIEIVSKAIASTVREVHTVSCADELVEQLCKDIKKDAVVVVMSNGSFDGIHQKILNKI